MLPAELIFVCLEQLPKHDWTRFRLVCEDVRRYIDRSRIVKLGKILISDNGVEMCGAEFNINYARIITDIKIGSTIRAPGSADHINELLEKFENIRTVSFETLFVSEPRTVVLKNPTVKFIDINTTNISLEFDPSSILRLALSDCPNIGICDWSKFTSLKWLTISHRELELDDPLREISNSYTQFMYQIINGKKELAILFNASRLSSHLEYILPAYGPHLNCSKEVYESLDVSWQRYLFPKFRKAEN